MRLKLFAIPLLCGITLALTGVSMTAYANSINPVPISGPVTAVNEGSITIDNQSNKGYVGEIIVSVEYGKTRVIDVTTGFPMAYSDIEKGNSVYAYIGNAMTASLPPRANADMILGNIPQDYKVPAYVQVESFSDFSKLTSTTGEIYTIPDSCTLLPYLTKNLVGKNDISKGRNVLIWSDENGIASKVVVFPKDENSSSMGWVKQDNLWYYYNENGSLHKGWLLDKGEWYYLNAETGAMITGFVTLGGKTYYLQADGKMLTGAKTFTPDENGVLH